MPSSLLPSQLQDSASVLSILQGQVLLWLLLLLCHLCLVETLPGLSLNFPSGWLCLGSLEGWIKSVREHLLPHCRDLLPGRYHTI